MPIVGAASRSAASSSTSSCVSQLSLSLSLVVSLKHTPWKKLSGNTHSPTHRPRKKEAIALQETPSSWSAVATSFSQPSRLHISFNQSMQYLYTTASTARRQLPNPFPMLTFRTCPTTPLLQLHATSICYIHVLINLTKTLGHTSTNHALTN